MRPHPLARAIQDTGWNAPNLENAMEKLMNDRKTEQLAQAERDRQQREQEDREARAVLAVLFSCVIAAAILLAIMAGVLSA